MKCPNCQHENPGDAKFCNRCGHKLELACPQCGKVNPTGSKFCNECGESLEQLIETEKVIPENGGERKHVTVLFSDLSGYTAMSEKLDPEELKEITSHIFAEISEVISKYEGFVEKFVGDAVMALLGVPKAHEDDPIRAIRAAKEIHELVEAKSPEVEKKIGQPISMHTGINTGLAVTGEVDLEKGTHGVAGDTINLASRLCSLAKSGEIFVGPDTYRQAEGHFTFESLEPTMIKGKEEPAQLYKVLSVKGRPVTMRRLSGLKADLIGRKAELIKLEEAVENLRSGKGSIFSIYGDAGTGKSRLIDEFKKTLKLKEIQWFEGHAYAYAQNIPYFTLIDLLNRVFEIEEGDPPEKVREKVESGLEDLVTKKEDVVPYVGSLYALNYPALEDISPEIWKSRLQDAIQTILSTLARKSPTVFCLEDLHWADPSFVELLRKTLLEVRQPAIVLCVYRPEFNLFTTHQLSGIAKVYQEIRLQDLSPSEAQDMLESMLKTDNIPPDLRRFVQSKAEGNPFYLEEMSNALIESQTLVRDDDGWRITRPITQSEISSTIHGVISSRLDRLERQTKRILQEASVIGRAFLYEILRRITELKYHIDTHLSGLERLDLIRVRPLQPDLEYIFKHALTQEVVYNGLLKKERQAIHERVGLVMEQLFHDRLSEFYETLAFHFKKSKSIHKAVDYLLKSGEKSMRRYSLDESHNYFKEAFEILSNKPGKTKNEELFLIDLLIKWGFVFYWRGAYRELLDLLRAHEALAESLDDKEMLGMFYAWLGFALYYREKLDEAYQYLSKAIKLGEEVQSHKVIGYACCWLITTCSDLGLLEEAIAFGKRAQKISSHIKSDKELFTITLFGMGMAYFFKGKRRKADEVGKILLDYGKKQSYIRSIGWGHLIAGVSHFTGGDFRAAIESFERSTQISVDPFCSYCARYMLGYSYVSLGMLQEGEDVLKEVMWFSENFGTEFLGTSTQALLSIILISKGSLSRGVRLAEDILEVHLKNQSRWRYANMMYILGKVYSQIVQRSGPMSFAFLAANIGFLLRSIPLAARKAEDYLNKAMEIAKEIGAIGILGQANLDLGLLHKAKKREDQARKCFSEAIQLFEKCETEIYLKQAREALASLQ